MAEVMTEGSKVTYESITGEQEIGIIKSFSSSGSHAIVVFNCDNDWDNYQHYTGALTLIKYLKPGWP